MLQMLKFISSMVFIVQPLCAMLRMLVRPAAAMVRYARPSGVLTRACYVLLGIALLFGALGAERGGQRNRAIVLTAAGIILLALRRDASKGAITTNIQDEPPPAREPKPKYPNHLAAPHKSVSSAILSWFEPPSIAMRGTVYFWDDHRHFGFIDVDVEFKGLANGDRLLMQFCDIVNFGSWCCKGARVAFKVRLSDERRNANCLQVENIQEPAPSTQNDGSQMPSDLLSLGWSRKRLAVNSSGDLVLPDDPNAIAWSLCGALNAVFEPDSDEWRAYLVALQSAAHYDLVRWNKCSGRTQQEVVELAMKVECLLQGERHV